MFLSKLFKKSKKHEADEKQEIQEIAKKVDQQSKPELRSAPAPKAKRQKREKVPARFVGSILLKPLITEKNTDFKTRDKYVFAVYPKANKIEVAKAVHGIYKVKPVKVNIVNMAGKNVRFGKYYGKRKSWKKAIVTLKKGDTIKLSS